MVYRHGGSAFLFLPLGAENGYTKLWDGTATPFDARKPPIPTKWRMHF